MPDLVALQSMLPKIDSPYEAQGKALQLRQLMSAGQQADYEAQQRQQAMADDQASRAAYRANPTDGTARLSAMAGISPKAYAAEAKSQADLAKSGADVAHLGAQTKETNLKALNQAFTLHRDQINLVNNPETAAQWVEAAYQDPVLGPLVSQAGSLEQAKARIPRDPEGFAKWKMQAGLNAEEYVKRTTVDANTAANNATSTANNAATNATSVANSKRTESTAANRLRFDEKQAAGSEIGDTSDKTVDLIGQGKMAPPSGMALRNPQIVAMMEKVAAKYPEFDATDYAGKIKAMRDFTTGKQGDSIRSFAVASDHLKQLDGLVDALHNGNVPLVNKIGNIIAQQTGSEAPTNFDAAKGIVAKEVLKSIVAGGGGVEERQELAHLLENAKTPAQLKGVIQTYRHLMEAQRNGLIRQYENSTGRKDGKTRFNYDEKEGGSGAGKVVDFGSLN